MKKVVVVWMLILGLFEFVNVGLFLAGPKPVGDWVYVAKPTPDSLPFKRLHLIFISYLGLLRLAFFFAPNNLGVYFVNLLTHLLEAFYFFNESYYYGGLQLSTKFLLAQPLGHLAVQFGVYFLNPLLLLLILPSYFTQDVTSKAKTN